MVQCTVDTVQSLQIIQQHPIFRTREELRQVHYFFENQWVKDFFNTARVVGNQTCSSTL